MQIERTEVGNVNVLRVEGDLDENGVNTLRDALLECITSGRCNVVMNLRRVGFISYLGLGVLVERLRKIRSCKGDIKLVGINVYAERLFRMVGVTSLFETYESETQAIGVFQQAA
jgi:anti-sigma B factor antagonist